MLTFRSRLSSPSVELTLSYSLVLEGLWRRFFTESWARVFSAFESRRSVSGTASFKSKKKMLQNDQGEKPLKRIDRETTDIDDKISRLSVNTRQETSDNHDSLTSHREQRNQADLGEIYKA